MKAPITFLQGIIIAIIAPIVLLVIFVIFSNYNTFKLVERDYYQKGINYQSQIDRETRANQFSQKVNIYNDYNEVVIQFPSIFVSEDIDGRIIFFRPSDSNLDFSRQIDLNQDGSQSISSTEFRKGAWIVKVFWNIQQDEYYSEKRIFVNR
ncbi:MAG: hypothetical protein GWP19_03255 [Planctomycetia bacterium]|nr:hypothetical protein [Planctomycetia bacterium]